MCAPNVPQTLSHRTNPNVPNINTIYVLSQCHTERADQIRHQRDDPLLFDLKVLAVAAVVLRPRHSPRITHLVGEVLRDQRADKGRFAHPLCKCETDSAARLKREHAHVGKNRGHGMERQDVNEFCCEACGYVQQIRACQLGNTHFTRVSSAGRAGTSNVCVRVVAPAQLTRSSAARKHNTKGTHD